MNAFWQGFFSIFNCGVIQRSPRIQRLLDESKRREQWYHPGEWWEHPLYGDVFKDKSGEK